LATSWKPRIESEDGIVELRAVDDAALQRRHDLAAGQDGHRRAQFVDQVGGEADGAVFQAACRSLGRGSTRFLNQPSGWHGIGPVRRSRRD
jgi:hypothetical protein